MTNEDIIERQQCAAMKEMQNTNWKFLSDLYKHTAKSRKLMYDAYREAGWDHHESLYFILNGS